MCVTELQHGCGQLVVIEALHCRELQTAFVREVTASMCVTELQHVAADSSL